MVSKKQLEDMAQVSIQGVDPGTLPDLLDVKIEGETPAQRLESYLAQVGNPDCFRVGKTPVRLIFNEGGKPLENKLKSYFLSLKSDNYLAFSKQIWYNCAGYRGR